MGSSSVGEEGSGDQILIRLSEKLTSGKLEKVQEKGLLKQRDSRRRKALAGRGVLDLTETPKDGYRGSSLPGTLNHPSKEKRKAPESRRAGLPYLSFWKAPESFGQTGRTQKSPLPANYTRPNQRDEGKKMKSNRVEKSKRPLSHSSCTRRTKKTSLHITKNTPRSHADYAPEGLG